MGVIIRGSQRASISSVMFNERWWVPLKRIKSAPRGKSLRIGHRADRAYDCPGDRAVVINSSRCWTDMSWRGPAHGISGQQDLQWKCLTSTAGHLAFSGDSIPSRTAVRRLRRAQMPGKVSGARILQVSGQRVVDCCAHPDLACPEPLRPGHSPDPASRGPGRGPDYPPPPT